MSRRSSGVEPPRLPRIVLGLLVPEQDFLLTELDELFAARVDRHGALRARLWYWSQTVMFGVAIVWDMLVTIFRAILPDVGELAKDFRYGGRRLFRKPGFLVATALTLGIGVGGLTTVYSVANWLVLRPVPGIESPDRLALIRLESNEEAWPTGFAWPISNPDLYALEELIPSIEALAGSTPEDVHIYLDVDAPAERLPAEIVTPNYFEVLGASPAAGRFFDRADQGPVSGPPEVVIGNALWNRLWRGRRDAIGATLRVNSRSYTVIGVAPPGFKGAELPGRAELWFPPAAFPHLDTEGGVEMLTNRGQQLWRQTIGRMPLGATVERVASDANTAMDRIREAAPGNNSFLPDHFIFRAYSGPGLSPWVRASADRTLAILAAAGVLLVLLALANVTSLALARLATRRPELTVRRALGSGTWRVAREPLVEALIQGLVGGGAGIGIAALGVRFFRDASLSVRGGSLEGLSLDWRVGLFGFTAAMLASLLAAAIPAIVAGRDAGSIGRPEALRLAASKPRIRAATVVLQVALSAVLLVGAGLLVRTVINIQSIDAGFDLNGLISYSIEPGLQGYSPESQRSMVRRFQEELTADRSVVSSGFISPKPLQRWRITWAFSPAGGNPRENLTVGSGFDITTGTLTTMGIEFIGGSDSPGLPPGAVIDSGLVILNETAARAAFPAADPRSVVGRTVQSYGGEQWTVAAVVADTRLISVTNPDGPVAFRLVHDLGRLEEVTGYVRTDNIGEGFLAIRAALGRVAPDLPAYGQATAREQMSELLAEQRVVARAGAVFAVTGVFLAAIGLYGLLAYGVAERTHEIGVRGALGASPGRILSAVVGRGFAMTLVGMALAIPLVYWSVKLVESRLYEVALLDPATYLIGATVIFGASLLASAVPGARAVRIPPAEALREE